MCVRSLAVGATKHEVAHPWLGSDILFRVEHRGGDLVVVIARVRHQSQPDLPQIVGTTRALRLVLGLAERREQQPGQNGNNRDHHQQFNQGECLCRITFDFHQEKETSVTTRPSQV